jgi:hypothetical protein
MYRPVVLGERDRNNKDFDTAAGSPPMSYRGGLAWRNQRHRQIRARRFGAIFLVNLVLACWLLS